MKHAILGAGGVGGLVGAVLANAGHDITFVVRPGTERDYPRELSLESTFGNIKAPVSVVTSLAEATDVLWIAVKATQLEDAVHSIPQNVPIKAIVPLLNGIDHVERLRRQLGREKVVPGTIAVESERIGPGKVVHRSPFVRFSLATAGKELLQTSVEAFRGFGFECRFVDDECTLLWSKLVFLAPVALSTTAARSAIRGVTSDPSRSAQLEACVREACACACAAGAKIDVNVVLAGVKNLPAGMRSSMEKDVTNGKTPELEAISGPILRAGETHSIPIPATRELVQMIQTYLQAC